MAKDPQAKGKRRSGGSSGEPLALAAAPLPAPPVWQRALGRLTGARACYGKPIEAYGHVVIPVATLRTLGGLGYGSGNGLSDEIAVDGPASVGGGGGGFIDARPVGFIDISPAGVRYEAIEVSAPTRSAGTTVLLALGTLAAARVLRGPTARLMQRSAAARRWPVRSLRR